jgi:15-cis-phytoene synthase
MATPGRTHRIPAIKAMREPGHVLSDVRQTGRVSITAIRALASDFLTASDSSEQTMSRHARTFRFAARFLPTEYREPTIRLYAFFRTLDDVVDEPQEAGLSLIDIKHELDRWEDWFVAGCRGTAPRRAVGSDVAQIRQKFGIPDRVFVDFLAGMRADLNPVTPVSRVDVEQYSYQVASTVGIAMAHIFGSTGPNAIEAASRLGIAMQLTNILRDVGGDLERGRIYLPTDLLAAHGLERNDIDEMWRTNIGPDNRLRAALREMIEWADSHYAAGTDGIRLLPADVRMPILVSARLYQQILRQLERNDFDSLRTRVATTRWQKIRAAYVAALDAESMQSKGATSSGERRTHAG